MLAVIGWNETKFCFISDEMCCCRPQENAVKISSHSRCVFHQSIENGFVWDTRARHSCSINYYHLCTAKSGHLCLSDVSADENSGRSLLGDAGVQMSQDVVTTVPT